MQTSLDRRRAIDRRDNGDETASVAYFDTQAGELTIGRLLQIFIVVISEVRGVRVEIRQHAFDGHFKKLSIGDLLDISAPDRIEGVGK